MATFLVTGVAGFIASRVAELLLQNGHSVIGIDNINSYNDVRLKTYRLHELASNNEASKLLLDKLDYTIGSAEVYYGLTSFKCGNFTFKRLDIEDIDSLKKLFSENQFDAVYNLAARAGVRYSMINPQVYMTTNAIGTLNILNCMLKNEVKKVILASTSSLYAGQKMPFNEDLPVNTPISPYAASKKAAEVLAYSYRHLYKIDVSIVRYFTVYGPASRPDMGMFRFIKWIDDETPIKLYGDGSQSRDFTYIDDIARGTILAEKELGYEIINLGGGDNPVSLTTIFSLLENIIGKKAQIEKRPFHIADVKETWADINKAKKLLDWEPEVSLEDGLKQSVAWYYDNYDAMKSINV